MDKEVNLQKALNHFSESLNRLSNSIEKSNKINEKLLLLEMKKHKFDEKLIEQSNPNQKD